MQQATRSAGSVRCVHVACGVRRQISGVSVTRATRAHTHVVVVRSTCRTPRARAHVELCALRASPDRREHINKILCLYGIDLFDSGDSSRDVCRVCVCVGGGKCVCAGAIRLIYVYIFEFMCAACWSPHVWCSVPLLLQIEVFDWVFIYSFRYICTGAAHSVSSNWYAQCYLYFFFLPTHPA